MCVVLKRNPLLAVKTTGGLDEAEHADLHQLIHLHKRGQSGLEVKRHALDHAHVRNDQIVAAILLDTFVKI